MSYHEVMIFMLTMRKIRFISPILYIYIHIFSFFFPLIIPYKRAFLALRNEHHPLTLYHYKVHRKSFYLLILKAHARGMLEEKL